MNILVVGATGMTGGRLVEQLLDKGHRVRAIVRSPDKFSSSILDNPNLEIVEAAVLDLTDDDLAKYVQDCDAVVSCLGHVLSFKGMFGKPRKLCTDAARRLCHAIEMNDAAKRTRFILMNTVGVCNPDLGEKRSWYDSALLGVLRHTMPPHRDNETAAEYLFDSVGKGNKHIEWCSVRPDSLINGEVSPYDIEASPVTGIFSGRPTTRSNVAHFMAELVTNDEIWKQWKFRMPVIMNAIEVQVR
jgi:nucleoside-diphosphate-sugar epimerase